MQTDDEYKMSLSEKTKNHRGGLVEKADESHRSKNVQHWNVKLLCKIFQKFLNVLNPNQTALFQKPRRISLKRQDMV